jgi:hypothetical protein
MGRRFIRASAIGIVLGLSVGLASAQQRAAGGPAYTPPKTPDSQPDLQGIWRVRNHAADDIQDHSASPGMPAAKGVVEGNEIPYRPEALEQKKRNFENSRTKDLLKSTDPLARCYMPGVPRITYLGWPFQIFQTEKEIVILYEWTHVSRHIYLDPNEELLEGIDSWMGTSRGHWDGTSLVVDVTGQNDRTWFDAAGNFHSDAMRVIERYTPVDRNTLRYDATIEDPKVFSRPWKMSMLLHRQTEQPLLEYECYMLLDQSGVPLTWPR